MIPTPVIIQDGRFRIHLNGTIERRPRHKPNQWEIAPKVHWSPNSKDYDAWLVTDTDDQGQSVTHYVHRLYAQAFVDNPDPKRFNIVLPKDGDRKNLDPENLFWTDHEHITHARLKGLEKWREQHAVPCNRCERPFVSSVGYTDCTQCRELIHVEHHNQIRHHKRTEPLETLDLSLFPERTQGYLRMRQEGKTYQEIADAFGVSRQAVNANIRRAMKKYKNTDYRMYKEKTS